MHQDVRPAEAQIEAEAAELLPGLIRNAAPGAHISAEDFMAGVRAAWIRMRARIHEPYRSQR